jgi:hypothetical protein
MIEIGFSGCQQQKTGASAHELEASCQGVILHKVYKRVFEF